MSVGALLGASRTTHLARLAAVALFVLAVVPLRDQWLPGIQSQREAKSPFVTSHVASLDTSKQDDIQATISDSTRLKNGDDEPCKRIPGADNVQVILKTGATELYQKLPTHFVTTFRCIPNFQIFSDLEQNFGDIHIYDAIAPVSKKIREEHEDFKLYRAIEKWEREGQDMSKLEGDGAWNLDKWKFLPMFHQAFESAADNTEWFVMIEADTSLSWTNLLLWLKTMDPSEPLYLGSQNYIGDTLFAHGGSGIVISRKAAEILEAGRYAFGREAWDAEWENKTANSCCGDAVVAEALMSVGVPLTGAWPVIQGETISTIDFTDHTWCTPPITFHHVSPIQVDSYWRFERKWTAEHGFETPYLFRDIFASMLERHVSVNRTSWNNLSSDLKILHPSINRTLQEGDDEETHNDRVPDWNSLEPYEQDAVNSEGACAAVCEARPTCVQWMWAPGRCHLGATIRFGMSDEREEEHWQCGWMQERVAAFRRKHEGCEITWAARD